MSSSIRVQDSVSQKILETEKGVNNLDTSHVNGRDVVQPKITLGSHRYQSDRDGSKLQIASQKAPN